MSDLPTADDAFGAAPPPPAAAKGLPSEEDAFGKAPASPGMLASLRKFDDKYLQGMGRQTVMAARAPVDAAVGLASMPSDAITSAVQYGKDISNGRKFSFQDLNPFSSKGGYQNPNLASNQIGSALDTVLPSPETTTEKVAHGVESFLSGAKMPIPGGIGTTASLAPETRAAAPQGYGVNFAGAQGVPGAPKAGDTARAAGIVKKKLLQDYTPWETAAPRVAEDNANGVPTRLTDIGPNTRSTGEVLAQKPGGASATMLMDRNSIAADTKTRIGERVRDTLDAQGDVGTASDDLTRARSANAKANYEAVRTDSTPVMDPAIWKILDNPTVAKIYQEAQGSNVRARRMLNDAGVPSPEMAEIYAQRPVPAARPAVPEPGVIDTSAMKNPPASPEPNAPVPGGAETEWVRTATAPDVQSLNSLQQLMNQKIGALYKAAGNGEGGAGNEASALRMLRDQLQGRLKEVAPSFKKASETYGDDSEVMDAMTKGRNGGKDSFFSMSPEQATKYVSNLSESGQSALRMGVADRLMSAAEMSGRNTNLASDILGGARKTELIHTLFGGDEQKFDLFRQALQKESELFQNNNAIRGGSQTFRRLSAAEDFSNESKTAENIGKGLTIASQGMHHWYGAGIHGLIRLMQGTTWNPSVATQAAKILSSKDPENALAALQSLEESLTTGVPSNKVKAITAATKGFMGDNTGNRLKEKYGVMQ